MKLLFLAFVFLVITISAKACENVAGECTQVRSNPYLSILN